MLTLTDLNEKLLKLESVLLKDLNDQNSLKDALFNELLKFGGSNTELNLYIEGFSSSLRNTTSYDEMDNCLVEYYEKLISDCQFDYELTAKIILSINHILYKFYSNTGVLLLFSDINNDILNTIFSRYLSYIGFIRNDLDTYYYKNNSDIKVYFDDGEVQVDDGNTFKSAYTIEQALNYVLSAISSSMEDNFHQDDYNSYTNTINRLINHKIRK